VGQRTTFVTPNIAQAKQLLFMLSDPERMGGLFAGLNTLAGAYKEGLLVGGGLPDPTTAKMYVAGALVPPGPAGKEAYIGAALMAGVTSDNWFAYYTYMLYLINELNGPLVLLDNDGIAPQNAGMFSKKSAKDLLFGYVARFAEVPGIAGPLVNDATREKDIDADYLTKIGRDIQQYTGVGDLEKTGLFVQYNGVKQYATFCELVDPAQTGMGGEVSGETVDCQTAAGRAVWDDPIFRSAEVIENNGDGMSQAPFKEGDSKRPSEYTLYVDEAKRVLPLMYDSEMTVKDIELRKYVVNPVCLVGDNKWRDFNKLRFDAAPAQVPNGFTSVQSVSNGVPVLLGLPRQGPLVDAGFTGGITCDGAPCSSTFDFAKHGTYVAVEPITGLTMSGHKRLQANLRISKHEYYTELPAYQGASGVYNNMFEGENDQHRDQLILPWYWVDLHDEITDTLAADFRDSRDAIVSGRSMGHSLSVAGITLGCVGLAASIGTIVFLFVRK
jgi:hypothetical protein